MFNLREMRLAAVSVVVRPCCPSVNCHQFLYHCKEMKDGPHIASSQCRRGKGRHQLLAGSFKSAYFFQNGDGGGLAIKRMGPPEKGDGIPFPPFSYSVT